MDLSLFFSSEYLFDSYPSTDFIWGFVLLGFFVLITFLPSFIKNFFAKNKYLKKSCKKKLWKYSILGIVGIVLILMRFGQIPVFSMRFILFLVFIFTVIFLLLDFIIIKKRYKTKIESVAREKNKRRG